MLTMKYSLSDDFDNGFLLVFRTHTHRSVCTVGEVMEEEDGASDEWAILSKEPEK